MGKGVLSPVYGLAALFLALCSNAALALGLGDIRVLSKPGQPLVAEIPVISNEAGELDDVRVALASPETFARVGLERPNGFLDDLQFQFAKDGRGRAVVRVTSRQTVQQKAINFLIEVEWRQGRLVREYSALVDAPNTAAAIAEPAIEAPQVAPTNIIVRPQVPSVSVRPPPLAVPVPAPATLDADDALDTTSESADVWGAKSDVGTAGVAPESDAELVTVQRGQTLSKIALQLARQSGRTLDQTMLALLRTNPSAFIGGNINLLKQGVVLRTPTQEALSELGAAEAKAMVREQAAQWRQARASIPQPAESGPGSQSRAVAGPDTATDRLEIAPAVPGDTKKAGTMSGTSNAREGDMPGGEQLQQAREDIASRDAEIQELRSRLIDLEQLRKKQQQLIALKDSELAAAQQHLPKTQAHSRWGGGSIWLFGGAALLFICMVLWWVSRRPKPSPLPQLPSRGLDSEALVVALPENSAAVSRSDFFDMPDQVVREGERIHTPDLGPDRTLVGMYAAANQPIQPQTFVQAHAANFAGQQAGQPGLPAGVRDRLELAVAYLDLGDKETARSLLREVVVTGDDVARAEAAALLNQIA
ncbi:FimV family protein [Xylella taiwanensis]|uniref:FimV family protein n=1 Tax=Xylella taiwanensis TaxID=1444770 RepID=Z9JIL6_9GAMM|nr:FimV/HubP family polar landmark protein [Xylella taiwanensis]EWS77853.1 membrane protein TspA [Xylella taiwanensis]MCD8457099.1 FimV family protein [Xylella taiwanensis]MCD8459507.1 FimV family protein [Xylella taiwanensis]MCD8461624.1 FimV family protein [Xylella taiwanensis]MCD8462348.1 FimV family protein [Xylella taiwanensis]